MRRGAILAGAALLLLVTACSGGANKKATHTPVVAPPATAAATAIPNGSPRAGVPVSSPQPGAAAPSTGSSSGPAAQVEQKLLGVLLAANEAPSPLQQAARQPLNNHAFAAAQPNPQQAEQAIDGQGRISGALVRFTAPDAQTPTAGETEITNLLVILSTYKSPQDASTGMAATLKTVTPAAADPHATTITSEPAQLPKLGDETTASLITVRAVLGGTPDTDVYAIGVRRGATTEVYVITGIGGAPTLDQVRQIVTEQDNKVRAGG